MQLQYTDSRITVKTVFFLFFSRQDTHQLTFNWSHALFSWLKPARRLPGANPRFNFIIFFHLARCKGEFLMRLCVLVVHLEEEEEREKVQQAHLDSECISRLRCSYQSMSSYRRVYRGDVSAAPARIVYGSSFYG